MEEQEQVVSSATVFYLAYAPKNIITIVWREEKDWSTQLLKPPVQDTYKDVF
jgi:hypothetical protein